MASMHKRPMKAKTRDRLIYVGSGVFTAGMLALILFGVKKCNDNADERDMLHRKEIISTLRLDSIKNENSELIVENDSLRKELDVANDSIVVLNTKNTRLKNEKDSIVAELDDCKASKQPVKKTPVKKTPVVVSKPAKPAVVKPMPRVQKPCEPVIVKEEAKNENTGSTTVNVNTPGNTVNISNGGIINNFYGDCDKTEKADTVYKEVVKYRRKVIMGHAVSNESVRCK